MADHFTSAKLQETAPERFVRLRKPLGVTSFGINQMVLEPGQRMRIHRHERQEEVFVVLSGRLTIAFEDGEQDFGPDELVRIAPEVRRQMINRGPERVSFLALGGSGEDHEPRDAQAFATWDGEPRGVADVPNPDDLPAAELRG
ncbi:cupin domain-containing protein [Patulibacter sp.]|uniref:cupin domain-containing protein n=1 Tax=Patulibacter sp. TaxID=1912859 RepID=UPI0027203F79|nr:cupin domain-containing protein [Patulibacter sp.]MDO9409757.1 cupin domain-containing protein [Patulibacter sp.]